MEPMITEDKISLWLVTLTDGNHYVMATLSVDTPHRAKFENDETHEPYDAWDVEECAFILPISNSNLPHYLRNHCWEDEPLAMSATFFPVNLLYVNCQQFTDFNRCWRFNFSKSLLACSRCIFSNCKKLKSYKDRHQKSEPTRDFSVISPHTNSI